MLLDVSYRPPFPLIGLNRIDLRDKWATVPEGYFGVCGSTLGLSTFECPEFASKISLLACLSGHSELHRYVITQSSWYICSREAILISHLRQVFGGPTFPVENGSVMGETTES